MLFGIALARSNILSTCPDIPALAMPLIGSPTCWSLNELPER